MSSSTFIRNILFWTVTLGLIGCSDSSDQLPSGDSRTLILVSIQPQAYLVDTLDNSSFRTQTLIPPGSGAESFEPNVRQLREATLAKSYFMIGHPSFPFERVWARQLLDSNSQLTTFDCLADLNTIEHDPHVWLSPTNMQRFAQCLAVKLINISPNSAQAIQKNLAKFLEETKALNEKVRGMLEPYEGRHFLVDHPAWGYFARDYGLIQDSIESEGKDPGPLYLKNLIDLHLKAETKVIFRSPLSPEEEISVIANELNAKIVTADDLAYNWSDNLLKFAENLKLSFQN